MVCKARKEAVNKTPEEVWATLEKMRWSPRTIAICMLINSETDYKYYVEKNMSAENIVKEAAKYYDEHFAGDDIDIKKMML